MTSNALVLAAGRLTLADLHERMAGGGGALSLRYHMSWNDPSVGEKGGVLADGASLGEAAGLTRDLAADFAAALERSRPAQLARGQQRTVALALKLAEARLMAQRRGDWPVVLLDDVLSELDPGRRGRLLSLLEDVDQTILTTADQAMLPTDWLRRATLLVVEAGAVRPHVASSS